MNEKSSKTLNVKYFLVYIIFTILLYSIFYYTSSFSYTKSVESLTLAKIAWPCCVLIGIVLYISQIIKHKNTLVNCGMFLSIYMVLLILLKSEGSLYDIITDSIYSMLWISLLCIFMFYSMKYGMPKGISKECFLFLPIITFIFIQLVISNQAKYYKVITLNPIFYILYLVPFLLLSKKSINSYIGLAIVFTSVILSHKRTALIILALIAVYCFFVQKNVNQNKTNKFVKNMLLSILFVAAIVFIYDYAVKNFNINWLQRLSTISETGGSGRVDRWRQFFIDMKRSNLFEFIAGHGIVYPYYHNDWMQIFYNTDEVRIMV